MPTETAFRVLFLAAEADPLIKVGGLGDVAGSLPRTLNALSLPSTVPGPDYSGLDVRLAIPFHGPIRRQDYTLDPVATFAIQHTGGPIRAEVFGTKINGVTVYLIAGAPVPLGAPVYTGDEMTDGIKYTFFSLSALELVRHLGWAPHILHANDWHTAPAVYALSRARDPFFQNTATLLGLHNLPYLGQGVGPALSSFGLPPASSSPLPWWAEDLPLPLGLLTANQIVAVSPTYAREILTLEFSSGLKDFLQTRAGAITGILNGLNTEVWDPAKDPVLADNYTQVTLARRSTNKTALLHELNLDPDPQIPLLALIARLDPQKGVDLVPGALRMIASQPWQAVILGTGASHLEAEVRKLESDFPGRVRAVTRFDPRLSHCIYAGADMLIIPSRYEPCGLVQMIAMRYGCVPVATAVGGLRDTIQDADASQSGTGFLFEPATTGALAAALQRALKVFTRNEAWQGLQRRGMEQDFSWERSARQYLELYLSLARKR